MMEKLDGKGIYLMQFNWSSKELDSVNHFNKDLTIKFKETIDITFGKNDILFWIANCEDMVGLSDIISHARERIRYLN